MKSMMIACAGVCLFVLSGCTPQGAKENLPPGDPDRVGFLGATTSLGSMLSTDSGCVFSFLQDHMYKERLPKAAASSARKEPMTMPWALRKVSALTAPDTPASWHFALNAPGTLAGADLILHVRGAYDSDTAGPVGTAKIIFGGQTEAASFTVAPPPTPAESPAGDVFTLEMRGKIAAGVNTIDLSLELAAPPSPNSQQRLEIFSLDIGVDGPGGDGPHCPKLQDTLPTPDEPKPEPAKP
ncbi:MAG TPA: hypothetical protein VGO52_04305 [Hyphomonadaceae bacterium]|jgi:hypothetical protein|nr:hypothetical protein [Hyphomonadaceae bacterium]